MIPLNISIKNFMCYRDNVPPLSFEGIHLACLCGDNGNGKSAIFDAITWALWGKARTNTNDQLIHASQSEMEVELEFTVQGQRYRIIRKYSRKPGSSTSRVSLELQIYDSGGYRSISGNNMTETGLIITELLHLDYDTFVNSAFLRQGHSNEFSIKEPAKRKDVLANILGLYQYDLIRDTAQKQAEDKKLESANIENTIQDTLRQLESREQYLQEGKSIGEQFDKTSKVKREIENKLVELREQKSVLDKKLEQLSSVKAQILKEQKELDEWKLKYEKSSSRLEELNKVVENRGSIESGYQEYIAARKKNEELSLKLSRLLEINRQSSELKEIINKESQQLSIEIQRLKELIKTEEVRYSQADSIRKEHETATSSLKILQEKEVDLENKKEQVTSLVAEISELQARIKRFDAQVEEDNEKIKLLGDSDSKCPLCEKALDDSERKNLNDKLEMSIETFKKEKAAFSQELMLKNKTMIDLKKSVSSEEASLKNEREKLQASIAVNRRRIDETQQAGENLEKARKQLEPLEARLTAKEYAAEARQKLNMLQGEIENTGYDKAMHERLSVEIKSLEKYEKLNQELENAGVQVTNEQRFVDDSREFINRINESIKLDTERAGSLSQEIESMSSCLKMLEDAEAEYRQIQNEENKTLSAMAVNQERLKVLDNLEAANKENEVLLKKLRFEEQINRELAEAFGRKGVQALLIREAFPEIELEANRLLGKMTDNRLSLKLESQKELKSRKGEVAETLDIIISDELGTRDYEMFSGGEAFRIDLALRIALSKLLVKRAGASMPILIIDEGFGTQDSTGRERLVEAIKSIEEDFEKIFVITHLEELKDSFPVAINVYKTPEGSMISVN